MPQLMSHWDGLSWQTPNVADMMDLPPRPLDRTGQLRGLATLIVRTLAELGAPARLKDVEPYTSHSRYILVPDKIGSRGNERMITQADLEKVMPQLLPHLEAEAVQLVTRHETDNAISLFLRTSINRRKRLRELLEDRDFNRTTNYTTLALGLDLDQKVILRELTEISHLLIAGTEDSRLTLMTACATALMLFNSPGYLRLALVGSKNNYPRYLSETPHMLGSVIENLPAFRRLLDGLAKHVAQRRRLLEKNKIASLDAYNKAALSNKSMTPLPRILMVVDVAALEGWGEKHDVWLVPLHQLLVRGPAVGLHTILSSPSLEIPHLPKRIRDVFKSAVVLPSVYSELPPAQRPAPNVPDKFIDGLLMPDNIPLELAEVVDSELLRLSTYWTNMKTRRNTEKESLGQAPSTGSTGLLNLRKDMWPGTAKLNSKDDLPQTNTLKPPTTNPPDDPPIIPDNVVASAQALGAYLGWLSYGPLRDVLQLNGEEAKETLRILQRIGVLELGEGPIWRFIRLTDPPDPRRGVKS